MPSTNTSRDRMQKIFHAQRRAVAFRIRGATIVKFTFVLTERVKKGHGGSRRTPPAQTRHLHCCFSPFNSFTRCRGNARTAWCSRRRYYLNDYDILTGRRLEDYTAQIRKFLDQGVPIGGIGVQGHLHGDSFDPAVLQKALDRLAQFKLPIRITEFNFPGQRSKYYGKPGVRLSEAEEQAKARALADYYRICFAHAAVEGILMWGFWEGANWIPVSSLYRRDWSPTPAAEAYRDLVFRQWWTRWQGKADAQGRCEVRAFFGKHRVTAGGKERIVELKPADPRRQVSFAQQ